MPAIPKDAIAPCGVNCALCMAYQRNKKTCPGCGGSNDNKPLHCVKCSIIHCAKRTDTSSGFCYECASYPCRRIRELDKRYQSKYSTSLINNSSFIQTYGVEAFIQQQMKQWSCPQCGTLLCVHHSQCPSCGYMWQQTSAEQE